MKLDSRYGEYLLDHVNYFGSPLKLKKSMCGMTNFGKIFADQLTNLLIDEVDFNQYKCKMSVYYKYASYGSKLIIIYYVDDCVYWYTY